MRQFIIFLILTLPLSVSAQENQAIESAAIKLADSLGFEELLTTTINQTRTAINSRTDSMIREIKNKLPNLSDEQNNELKDIFIEYTNSVMNSIDTNKATLIYTSTLAKNLTPREIEEATNYYNSKEGKKVLKTVSEALTEFNKYIISEMSSSAEKSQARMMQRIVELRKELNRQKPE